MQLLPVHYSTVSTLRMVYLRSRPQHINPALPCPTRSIAVPQQSVHAVGGLGTYPVSSFAREEMGSKITLV